MNSLVFMLQLSQGAEPLRIPREPSYRHMEDTFRTFQHIPFSRCFGMSLVFGFVGRNSASQSCTDHLRIVLRPLPVSLYDDVLHPISKLISYVSASTSLDLAA